MQIVVCLKQIPDPEVPVRDFRIDTAAGGVSAEHCTWVINPFDENALEVALLLKEQVPDATITALCLGGVRAEEALRRALALKVDQAVLVSEDTLTGLDSYGTAVVLAAALHRLGPIDLVLCGRQAGDWDHGQVGALLAEMLVAPYIPFAFTVAAEDRSLMVAREIANGSEFVQVATPAVVTVTNHASNQLRLPKVRDLLLARRQPVTVWSTTDLAVTVPIQRVVLTGLSVPLEESVGCEMIPGDSPEQQAEALLMRLVSIGLMQGSE